jgi:uncharacterized membrane protein YedE/YeeE
MDLTPAIASIVLGAILGYVGQRSRLCFIGGMRDWWLVKDTYLLKGLVAFIGAAFIGFGIFHFFSPAIKTFPWFINGGEVFVKKWAALGIEAQPSFMLPLPGDLITWSPGVTAHVVLAMIGGFGMGLFAVLAGGCPFRQHVMAAEGSISAMTYLLGFAAGAVLFHKCIAPLGKLLF